ncbi:MAG: AAA family ATPase [Clostridiales bacterium]|nr:AAA family ATPase [Clostridiales bacterium]
MDGLFVSGLTIENVRNLKNIKISLSKEKIKHLIFTGKNGSGKTSVLEALSCYLGAMVMTDETDRTVERLTYYRNQLNNFNKYDEKNGKTIEEDQKKRLDRDERTRIKSGVDIEFEPSRDAIRYDYAKGNFILAYYRAERVFSADISNHIEKVELKDSYTIKDKPGQLFVKYLVDLKVTEALARNSGKIEKAEEIRQWFVRFQKLLRDIFGDDSLELLFNEDRFAFTIRETGKELFDFNTLSGGYAAVLDIVLDIIMRMEKQTERSFHFNVPGLVLIDEIETHLHIEMQKEIMRLLTTVFPNIQFIVTTHSPFILNSIPNAVIYDLEKRVVVENGLSDIPYGGIVEGYFESSELSKSLEEKFERYKSLVSKKELTDDDFEEIAELEMYLDEIPDYLALNITEEYKRLKLEFDFREDL